MPHKIKHLAIIPDGNYRFAQKQNMLYEQALEQGAQRIRDAIDWCYEQHIPEITVWLFSTENMKRSEKKVKAFRQVIGVGNRELEKQLKRSQAQIKKYSIRIIGDLEQLPKELRQTIRKTQEQLPNGKKLQVNFAMIYGGRQELVQIVKTVMKEAEAKKILPKDINEEYLTEHLMIKNDVDLIIRAGGEQRMSGFLPWQSTYAELFFLEKLWPEITKKDLNKVLEEYNTRKRKFGK